MDAGERFAVFVAIVIIVSLLLLLHICSGNYVLSGEFGAIEEVRAYEK